MRHFSRKFILENDTFSQKKKLFSIKTSKPNIIKHFPTHYTRNFLNFLRVPDIISQLIFNVAKKYKNMRQFSRKCILENDSFSKKNKILKKFSIKTRRWEKHGGLDYQIYLVKKI